MKPKPGEKRRGPQLICFSSNVPGVVLHTRGTIQRLKCTSIFPKLSVVVCQIRIPIGTRLEHTFVSRHSPSVRLEFEELLARRERVLLVGMRVRFLKNVLWSRYRGTRRGALNVVEARFIYTGPTRNQCIRRFLL